MKAIILPGNSARNREWLEAATAHYQDLFDEVYAHPYAHWESGETQMDFGLELTKLKEANFGDENLVLIAKSVGTLLALLAVQQEIVKPSKCIFFGMPLAMASEGIFKDDMSALTEFSVPTLVFHNDEDPTADYTSAKQMLEGLPNFTFVTTHAANHDYIEFTTFECETKALILRSS